MNAVLFVGGVALVVAAVVDLLWTTLWVDGGEAPLSSRISNTAWKTLRRAGAGRSAIISLAGPIVIVIEVFTWVGTLWAGWTLLFAAHPDAIVDTSTGATPSWPARIYFVGYSMFTMGNGEFAPTTGFWQLVTAGVTASGMLLVTLAVTYILSVLNAVTQKRSFAGAVHGLGSGSSQILTTAWDGRDLRRLDLPLNDLASRISLLAQQHRAYPILHYYHSAQADDASSVAVAVLDEALTLIQCGVSEAARPNTSIVASVRSSIGRYLTTLASAFIRPAHQSPDPPPIEQLRAAGIPTAPEAEFDRSVADLSQRRRQLLGMVADDAWGWPRPEPQPR